MSSSSGEPIPNGIRAFETLKNYLAKNAWNVEPFNDRYVLKSTCLGAGGISSCFFEVWADLEQFIFYIIVPMTVPKEKLPKAAEYISRVNSGMRIGNFEIDFDNGDVRFKSSINFRNQTLTDELIHGVIEPALDAFNNYFPGLINVIMDLDTPAQALYSIDYRE